ncbi:MAG: VOC family protein [Gammaproteobacteria bacterium]|nr:VOC family protein [Gammaproteobacteria bacterium]MBT5685136.1 VOC family protein [Gammaproteobacteria bacterium]MBT6891421.1 VOC family protein [Gammaproteobacteria bacterium]MBT7878556.1 VOC family protein [Gammaproteobacteria bacterium]
MKLDHIMFAVSDLDAGIEQLKTLTGVSAEFGGSHAGAGTRNALLSFGNEQYLEIIAPDPMQDIAGTMGAELSSLQDAYIRTWAVATEDYTPVISVLERFGYGHHIIEMSRTRPDGIQLAWQILFVTHQPHGLAMPFFINWLDSKHPAQVAPSGCELEWFSVQCPGADAFQRFCGAIDINVSVVKGALELSAQLQSPLGAVALA